MRKSRFTDEQVVTILNEHAAARSVIESCRRHGLSEQTIEGWK